MMVVKFAMVAGWFMHLRFDSNLFTRMFVSGIVLAVTVYVAALAAFEFFSSDGVPAPAIPVEQEAP
jgi:cytochrome c oxidase subunit IV